MTFADRIAVNARYTRSINVERDQGSHAIVQAYLPSAASVELLDTVADTFGTDDQPRAWSLIGPYGSGKSSFALFLHELLGAGGSRTRRPECPRTRERACRTALRPAAALVPRRAVGQRRATAGASPRRA